MLSSLLTFFFFFFNDTATTEIYTLSLHDALPISLHGEVHVLAYRRRLRHGGEHALAEVRGIGRREPQAADPGHAAHGAQQVPEVVLAVVVAVDRLAKERHLRGAARDETLHLAHHVGQLATPLRPARHRNDAERAPIIAAALHGDERGGPPAAPPGLPRRRHVLVVLPRLEPHVGRALPLPRPGDQLG